WGTEVFEKLNGMFAVAIWDSLQKRLILARDRMGEKPLYVGALIGGGWVFGSELKALLKHPDLERTIDLSALEQFLAFDFVVGPKTILKGVTKIPAGHVSLIDQKGRRLRPYWLPTFQSMHRAIAEILEELDGLLARSVAMRM